MAVAAPWSTELTSAIHAEDADAAMRAGLAAVGAKVAPTEIARSATLAYAESVDPAPGAPLRGLLALSSAVRLGRHLSPRQQSLPVLRALSLAAADKKLPASERPRRGEDSRAKNPPTPSLPDTNPAGHLSATHPTLFRPPPGGERA